MRLHSGLILMGALLLTFMGCTSHPVISPDPLDVGETYHGMAVSVENVVPQYVFRAGVSPRMDVGCGLVCCPSTAAVWMPPISFVTRANACTP